MGVHTRTRPNTHGYLNPATRLPDVLTLHVMCHDMASPGLAEMQGPG